MRKIKSVIISLISMVVFSIILLFIASFIITKMGILPQSSLPIITTLISCLVVFLSGFISSLYMKEKGILFGLISASIYSLIIILCTLVLSENILGVSAIGRIVAIFISGAMGGIIGVNRKSKIKF